MTTFPFYPKDRAQQYELYAAEYAFEQTEPTPWSPLRRELRQCRVALVTTAGLRLKTQRMFSSPSAEFREISVYTPPEELAFDFTNYDPTAAEEDLNVLVPVDRLKDRIDRGELGGLHETFFSFFGLCADLDALKASASAVGDRLHEAECDLALVVAANAVCNQTAPLVARGIEARGVATVTAVTIKEVARQVAPPRSVFVNFPFGRTLGAAGDAATQDAVLGDMLRAARTMDRPGKMIELKYTWKF